MSLCSWHDHMWNAEKFIASALQSAEIFTLSIRNWDDIFFKIFLYAGDCAISFLSDLILSEVNWGYCSFIWHLCRYPFCLKIKRRLKRSIGSDVCANFRSPFPFSIVMQLPIILNIISWMTPKILKRWFIFDFKNVRMI